MEVTAIVFIGWLLSVCLHEWGHAVIAYFGGDTSVKDKGYLTLNILKYTNPQTTFIIPIILLMLGGIPLPGAAVYIDNSKLRDRTTRSMVSAAGPFMTLVAAVVFSLPFALHLSLPHSDSVMPALAFLVVLQFLALIFNLLPIPGFDGFGIISPWLPDSIRNAAYRIGYQGMFLAFVIIWMVPGVNQLLWGTCEACAASLGVPMSQYNDGYNIFFKNRYWLAVALGVFLLISRKHMEKQTPADAQATAVEYYQAAREKMQAGHIDDALKLVNACLQKNPRIAEAWHLRGACLGLHNQNEDALKCFDTAISLNPEYADCWYNKACCHSILGQKEEAISALGQALKLNPSKEVKAYARRDPGFRQLHGDARFERLVLYPDL